MLFNPVSSSIPFVDTETERAFSDSCAQLWERFSPITSLRNRTFDFRGGGRGGGYLSDLVWVNFFSQATFPRHHYTPGGIIFLCEGYLFPRYFLPTYYFPSKSVSRIFFSSNHPSITPCLYPPPPLTQKSNGRKLTCSPALPKQRLLLLLVLESILQILHYKTVLVNYLLSYFLSYPKILTVGFAANYNKAFP